MNTVSVIVRALPENVPAVEVALKMIELCEIHFRDEEGRIVVTLEGTTTAEVTDKLFAIQQIPHVLSADLTYATRDDEVAESGE